MPDKAIVTCLFVQIFINESKKPSGFHVCHPTRVLRCFLGFDPFPVCVQCGLGALPEFGSSMRPGHLYGMSFTEAGSESSSTKKNSRKTTAHSCKGNQEAAWWGGEGSGSGPLMEPTDPFNQGRWYGVGWSSTPSHPLHLFHVQFNANGRF